MLCCAKNMQMRFCGVVLSGVGGYFRNAFSLSGITRTVGNSDQKKKKKEKQYVEHIIYWSYFDFAELFCI